MIKSIGETMKKLRIEEEIDLLHYKIKTLMHIVDIRPEHFFSMIIIDSNLREQQVNSILKLMDIYHTRLNGSKENITKEFNLYESEYPNGLGGIPSSFIWQDEISLDNFTVSIRAITEQDIDTNYLLLAMKSQSIYINVCKFLLNE